MAEYWKSAPRFWCKQCKIFIRDTPFEKTQHEASPKHQGSLRRFLNQIHKDNEQQQRDSSRAKSEVERLRQAVSGSTEKAGAPPPKRNAPPAPKPAPRMATAEERKKQIAQLAEMGVAVPEEYRADMALAGEWQTTSETRVEPQQGLEGPTKSIGVRKRKHEGEDEEDEPAPEMVVNKSWGSRLKQYPGAQDDRDLDDLLASAKDIKMTKTFTPKPEIVEDETTPGEPASVAKKENVPPKLEQPVKEEPGSHSEAAADTATTENPPSEDVTPSVVFKKRKAKTMRK
ncbi:unnamed protein product [Penicillium salamii]|uniref:U1-type domain-containing protein n=1 Tax=Penicillium salamii TaxID=1612424 RepID=A0A9W4I4V1_9EURO|nr:unnamed protein product [Penicillium salamii]CAG8269762.1 unnamed protein product [Penicillium salamii]CAG8379287.1 unnamed protein product [Penicillium salamii]CAG8380150.1 unnamed protein product [Penicillium salamii]